MNKEDRISKQDRYCPDRFPSPQLPSPTDCLPPNELARVLEQIKDANELLLDLALSDDRPAQETYRKVFSGLMGVRVEIKNQQLETVEGVVIFVGYDFIILREGEYAFIFLFEKMERIEPYGKYAEPYPTLELGEIEPSLRRELTFNFGKIVAASPELIHLFFGIRLEKYLLSMEDKRIKINMGDISVDGLLMDADKKTITLDINGEKNVIPIEKVLLITINA